MADEQTPGPSGLQNAVDSEDDFAEQQPTTRCVYLITYSKADVNVCDSREKFAEIVKEAFSRQGTAKIIQYVESKELHKDGHPHFHMCLKLDKQKKWMAVRNYIDTKYGIKVNFSNNYSNYYGGYIYVTKSDPEYIVS